MDRYRDNLRWLVREGIIMVIRIRKMDSFRRTNMVLVFAMAVFSVIGKSFTIRGDFRTINWVKLGKLSQALQTL